jgi:hypothetical protein
MKEIFLDGLWIWKEQFVEEELANRWVENVTT